jgi:Amt family ammonium transporter
MILEYIFLKRISVVGASTGVVAGLVAITPASGYVDITAAIIIGAVVSIISYTFMAFIRKLMKYDDALDVFSVHGLGGIWGAIATGIFANPVINSLAKGALYGNPGQIGIQLMSVLIAAGISIVGTLICLFITDLVTGKKLRVEPQDEIYGLDLTQHGERIESK